LNRGLDFNGKGFKNKLKKFSFKIWKLGRKERPLQTEKNGRFFRERD
jgi:hypothetical protein